MPEPVKTSETASCVPTGPASDPGIDSRVAEVTLALWVMKVLATTFGETAGDFLSMTLKLGYTIGFAITFALLAVVLRTKVRAEGFGPVLFWTAIVAATTAGTEVSDLMDRPPGLGYLWGPVLLVADLAATLIFWKRRHGSLSVAPILTRSVEVLLWVAVVFSNSLGTAFGDFLTDNPSLSYLQGAFDSAGVIGVVPALHYATRVNAVPLVWLAFAFTRPFGVTFGDVLTEPVADGGLSLPRERALPVTLAALAAVPAFTMVRASRTARQS